MIQTEPDNKGNIEYIPLRELVTIAPAEDLKSITSGRNGEYVPFNFYDVQNGDKLMREVKQVAEETKEWDTGFSGSFFSNKGDVGRAGGNPVYFVVADVLYSCLAV